MKETVSPRSRAFEASLARSVTVTWWYTAGSVVLFEVLTLLIWVPPVLLEPGLSNPTASVALFVAGAVVSIAATIPLLLSYRVSTVLDRAETAQGSLAATLFPPVVAWSLGATAVAAVLLALGSGALVVGGAMLGTAVCLVRWPRGVRWRVVVLVGAVLVALWVVQRDSLPVALGGGDYWVHLLLAVWTPAVAVFSLWWWDLVVELDRARHTEGRLAAVQERLRLASDLHDLQGHHLQVIALQLELAERMLPGDPAAAASQVSLARASVEEARAGTRELASRFRGVPLPDELANAADLLRAAGIRVELRLDPAAQHAPADVLGPIVRELTTNVLRHGAGEWAQLALVRTGDAWSLRFANDPGDRAEPAGDGSGLRGVAERVGAGGGSVSRGSGRDAFEVVVTLPDPEGGAG